LNLLHAPLVLASDLVPSSSPLSLPSSQLPYSVQLSLLPPSDPHPTSRSLLDIEKLTLSTDAQGRVNGESTPLVELRFIYSGRAPTPSVERVIRQRDIEYVALCETLIIPGLPSYIPYLGLFLLIALIITIKLILPSLISHVRHVAWPDPSSFKHR
jgi:hypothetical protein